MATPSGVAAGPSVASPRDKRCAVRACASERLLAQPTGERLDRWVMEMRLGGAGGADRGISISRDHIICISRDAYRGYTG